MGRELERAVNQDWAFAQYVALMCGTCGCNMIHLDGWVIGDFESES